MKTQVFIETDMGQFKSIVNDFLGGVSADGALVSALHMEIKGGFFVAIIEVRYP